MPRKLLLFTSFAFAEQEAGKSSREVTTCTKSTITSTRVICGTSLDPAFTSPGRGLRIRTAGDRDRFLASASGTPHGMASVRGPPRSAHLGSQVHIVSRHPSGRPELKSQIVPRSSPTGASRARGAAVAGVYEHQHVSVLVDGFQHGIHLRGWAHHLKYERQSRRRVARPAADTSCWHHPCSRSLEDHLPTTYLTPILHEKCGVVVSFKKKGVKRVLGVCVYIYYLFLKTLGPRRASTRQKHWSCVLGHAPRDPKPRFSRAALARHRRYSPADRHDPCSRRSQRRHEAFGFQRLRRRP